MRWLLAALLLLLAPLASAGPLIVGVVPDLPGGEKGDEGAAVWSPVDVDLAGYSLFDGQRAWRFPAPFSVAAGETVWIVGNRTVWSEYGMPEPRLEWTSLQLANGGDGLQLRDPTGVTILDGFAWGTGNAPNKMQALQAEGPGRLYERIRDDGVPRDTDTAGDWMTPRMHVVGESHLDAPSFQVHKLTFYASPDDSFDTLAGLLGRATQRVTLHVYELRSAELVDALVQAKHDHPALDLEVLVEGSPVGRGQSNLYEAADALRRITDAGGHAFVAGGTPGGDRYDYHHLKVLVVDGAVAVQSENWVPTGVPADPSQGNRGWGVVVHDQAMADWFSAWMAEDRAAWDTIPFDLATFAPRFIEPARGAPPVGPYGPIQDAVTLEGDFVVRPIVTPDLTADPATDPVAALVRGAQHRVWTQQLDLATGAKNNLGWHGDDALLSALEDRARAGVDVRVQAAPPFDSESVGNRDALALLTAAGAKAVEFDRPGITTLHNKGFIVDDTLVVGSMNGNHHSRSQNREVDLIVSGPGVTDFHAALFRSDEHAPADPPRDPGVIPDDLNEVPLAPVPILLLVLLVFVGRRR